MKLKYIRLSCQIHWSFLHLDNTHLVSIYKKKFNSTLHFLCYYCVCYYCFISTAKLKYITLVTMKITIHGILTSSKLSVISMETNVNSFGYLGSMHNLKCSRYHKSAATSLGHGNSLNTTSKRVRRQCVEK